MESAFGFPRNENADVRVFNANGSTNNWQVWEKPRGCSMVFMLAVGSGGGGGGGFTGSSGANRGGGGGGGSGALTKLLVPAFCLPDRLYVQIGLGGLASTGSGVAGSNGASSFISAMVGFATGVASNSINLFLASGATTPATGGGAGTGAALGGAGAAEAPSVVTTNCKLAGTGMFVSQAGGNGGAGGAHTGGVGSAVTAVNFIFCGGAGGGGVTGADTAGGAITGQGPIPTVPGGAAGTNNGLTGTLLMGSLFPLCGTGGSGGGGSNGGAGGRGGDGAIGSGGGGGGAGTTGGGGGRGGDGLVIICAF